MWAQIPGSKHGEMEVVRMEQYGALDHPMHAKHNPHCNKLCVATTHMHPCMLLLQLLQGAAIPAISMQPTHLGLAGCKFSLGKIRRLRGTCMPFFGTWGEGSFPMQNTACIAWIRGAQNSQTCQGTCLSNTPAPCRVETTTLLHKFRGIQ